MRRRQIQSFCGSFRLYTASDLKLMSLRTAEATVSKGVPSWTNRLRSNKMSVKGFYDFMVISFQKRIYQWTLKDCHQRWWWYHSKAANIFIVTFHCNVSSLQEVYRLSPPRLCWTYPSPTHGAQVPSPCKKCLSGQQFPKSAFFSYKTKNMPPFL